MQYHGDTELHRLIQELAELSNEGQLTPEDRAEYEGYVQANKFVAILPAKVRKLIADSES